ncbi:MAG: HAD family hydrolase [Tractidigestivibacter sp.]|jgi:hydroxymethylpyrimidine pyrophosphatase-like HAD family hydrolase|uniref:HAD family hydrolase n=1 Tax=Tractidigestivibacter sp. TaxID=2847320 RepID=UPI003D906B4D
MIKLALSDLDNTLVWGDMPRVATPATRKAIHQALHAGVRFAPATGRKASSLPELFCQDEKCYETALANNGQTIYLDGKLVHEVDFSPSSLQRAAQALEPFGDAWLVVDFLDEPPLAIGAPMELIREHPEHFWRVKRSADKVPERPIPKASVRVIAGFSRGRKIRHVLADACPDLDFVFPTQERPLIDVVPRGWGKGAAGLWLAKRLGIAPDEVCCFGDAGNDLEMFSRFSNSVAVENAKPDAAAAARWHIGPASEDSVGKAIAEIARAAAAGEDPSFMRD